MILTYWAHTKSISTPWARKKLASRTDPLTVGHSPRHPSLPACLCLHQRNVNQNNDTRMLSFVASLTNTLANPADNNNNNNNNNRSFPLKIWGYNTPTHTHTHTHTTYMYIRKIFAMLACGVWPTQGAIFWNKGKKSIIPALPLLLPKA